MAPWMLEDGRNATQQEADAAYAVFQAIVRDAVAIRNRIVAAGGMATKTVFEDELMPKHCLDRRAAHDVMNHIEYHNLK